MELSAPRGTRDFLPEAMIARKRVIAVIEDVFTRYGYSPIETPAFEHLETLACKGGDEVDAQIYVFEDKSGRKLGLRFDLTTPLARVVAQNPNLPMPFKRYHVSRVWRYENQQKGRYREFWQADVDVVGASSMLADAEVVAVAVECLRALGFSGLVVRLNHRRLLGALVAACGVTVALTPAAFRAMDKLDKIGRDGVHDEMVRAGVDEEAIWRVLEAIDAAGPPVEVLARARPLVEGDEGGRRALEELGELVRHLASFGVREEAVVDLTLVRGLSYYTGPIFEVSIPEGGVGSVAGGGRYDGLVEQYGAKPQPAVGISLGIERLMAIIQERGMLPVRRTVTEVLVAPVNPDVLPAALALAQELRAAGVSADLDLRGRKLPKLFEHADAMAVPFVLVVGPKDLGRGVVVLRNMASGDQAEVPLAGLGARVRDAVRAKAA